MMVVKIEAIREHGLKLDEQVDLKLLGEALEGSGFRPVEPFALHATLNKVSRGVLLKGHFTSRVATPCKRCLAEATMALPVQFTLNLVPESLVRGADEAEARDRGVSESGGSFELEDADEEVFDGKTIDLEPIVREQVLLALPMNALCREDCLGLCSQCGQNLNEQRCSCDTRSVDPRFAVLKTLKIN